MSFVEQDESNITKKEENSFFIIKDLNIFYIIYHTKLTNQLIVLMIYFLDACSEKDKLTPRY